MGKPAWARKHCRMSLKETRHGREVPAPRARSPPPVAPTGGRRRGPFVRKAAAPRAAEQAEDEAGRPERPDVDPPTVWALPGRRTAARTPGGQIPGPAVPGSEERTAALPAVRKSGVARHTARRGPGTAEGRTGYSAGSRAKPRTAPPWGRAWVRPPTPHGLFLPRGRRTADRGRDEGQPAPDARTDGTQALPQAWVRLPIPRRQEQGTGRSAHSRDSQDG